MVVDVGSVGAAKDVESYLKEIPQLRGKKVAIITATHFHIDHIGGIGHLLKNLDGRADVLFSPLVQKYLSRERKLSLIHDWQMGLLPATLVSFRYVRRFSHLYFETLTGIPIYGFRNFFCLPYKEKIHFFMKESSSARKGTLVRYTTGFEDWDVIETPGHTEDSICFYSEKSQELICGDLIVSIKRNGRGNLNRFCWSKEVNLNTYQQLCREIKAKVIYPGHGEVIVDDKDAFKKVDVFRN